MTYKEVLTKKSSILGDYKSLFSGRWYDKLKQNKQAQSNQRDAFYLSFINKAIKNPTIKKQLFNKYIGN